MDMRIRLPELLEEHQVTPYEIAKRSAGRISASTLYRLNRKRGVVELISADLLEALCDVLHVEPGELLERDSGKRRRGGRIT